MCVAGTYVLLMLLFGYCVSLLRLKGHCGWEPEADPGFDLDTDPALLYLHAHVGG